MRLSSNYLERLERRVEPMKAYSELVSAAGVRRVGECARAAHYVAHTLTELHDDAQLLELLAMARGSDSTHVTTALTDGVFGAEAADATTFFTHWVQRCVQAPPRDNDSRDCRVHLRSA